MFSIIRANTSDDLMLLSALKTFPISAAHTYLGQLEIKRCAEACIICHTLSSWISEDPEVRMSKRLCKLLKTLTDGISHEG